MVSRTIQALSWVLLVSACTSTESTGPDTPLEPEIFTRVLPLPPPGERREVELSSGEAHVYRFELRPGEAFSAEIDQLGLDVLGEVYGSQGLIRTVDSPLDDQGPERLCLVGDEAETALLDLRIRPFEKRVRGRYALEVRKAPATDWDRHCDALTREFDELEILRFAEGASVAERLALIPRYERIARDFRELDLPFQAAAALKAVAVLRDQEGRVPEQIAAYSEALELFRQAGHPNQEAHTLNQLGVAQDKLGDLGGAYVSFRRSLKISTAVGDATREEVARHNLGRIERRAGNWLQALEIYEGAYEAFRAAGRLHRAAIAQSNAAVCLTAMQRYPDALGLLSESRATLEALGEDGTLAQVWNDIGRVYHMQREYDQAQDALRQALQLEPPPIDRAIVLGRMAAVQRDLGRYEESLETYREALELAEQSGSQPAQVRLGLATVLQKMARPEEAIEQIERAYPALMRVNDPDSLAYAQAVWARAERDLGRPEAARSRMEHAFQFIEVLRSAARAFGDRLRPQSNFQSFLEFYVLLLLEMHQSRPELGLERAAFEFADLERGRLFYETLAESQLRVRDDVPYELLQEEKEIQLRMNGLYDERTALLARGGRDEEVARIDQVLRRLARDYDRVRARIVTASHHFPELRNPRRPDLRAIQDVLDPDTTLLRFFLGEESSVLFLVGRSHFSSHRLPARKVLEDLAQVVYDGWSSQQRRKMPGAALATEMLSEHLLGPLEAQPESRRLVIVADGTLHYLPFSTLRVPVPLAEQPDQTLVDRYELVQLPLAAALEDLHRRESVPPPPRLITILADPVFSQQDERLEADTLPSLEEPRLPLTAKVRAATPRRLHWSGREASSILGLVPSGQAHVALGFEANRELVLSGHLADYRFIHIASHAVIDEEHPSLSRLILSGVTPGGRPLEEGEHSVALHEFYSLKLPAGLIVLSGCETALGERVQGEGLVGWARGFFYAGASKLMVSLWEIDDEATATFMPRFYEGIFVGGKSPAAALRDAQRFMKDHPKWNAPYFWAGFVLLGDWHAIPLESGN